MQQLGSANKEVTFPFLCKITSLIPLTCAPNNFFADSCHRRTNWKRAKHHCPRKLTMPVFKRSGWAVIQAIPCRKTHNITKRSASEHLHTKALLFRSIFPAKGPHVVPTGSCCRLWILRSPSFWTSSSSPANKANTPRWERFHLSLDNNHLCLCVGFARTTFWGPIQRELIMLVWKTTDLVVLQEKNKTFSLVMIF